MTRDAAPVDEGAEKGGIARPNAPELLSRPRDG